MPRTLCSSFRFGPIRFVGQRTSYAETPWGSLRKLPVFAVMQLRLFGRALAADDVVCTTWTPAVILLAISAAF
ncbi:hypothetical protein VTJ04DRAFT_4074 [Mycothermus thermophilus]|uniref:uncharacterized protein n=1 Tax=Humicola insolens TaxID=85995 RepID=UPI003742B57E